MHTISYYLFSYPLFIQMERVEIDTLRVIFSVLSAGLKILSNLIHRLPILVCEVKSPPHFRFNLTE
jgi:hypothetical protein